jgi:hypothetical protein
MCEQKHKPNLIYDASILTSFFEKNESRTGVFFVAYNILMELERRRIFNIKLYFNHNPHKYIRLMRKHILFSKFNYVINNEKYNEKIISGNILIHKEQLRIEKGLLKAIRYLKIIKNYLRIFKYRLFYRHKNNKIFEKTDIFISPYSSLSYDTEYFNHIKNFIFLYDMIPVLFPEYFLYFFSSNDRTNEYAKIRDLNKESYYFCISECTKRDFLKYYISLLDERKIFVTHIATSQIFLPEYDKIKLNKIFIKYNINHKENDKYIFSLCTLEPRKNLLFTISCFIKFISKHSIQNLFFYLGGAEWDILEFQKKLAIISGGVLMIKSFI